MKICPDMYFVIRVLMLHATWLALQKSFQRQSAHLHLFSHDTKLTPILMCAMCLELEPESCFHFNHTNALPEGLKLISKRSMA